MLLRSKCRSSCSFYLLNTTFILDKHIYFANYFPVEFIPVISIFFLFYFFQKHFFLGSDSFCQEKSFSPLLESSASARLLLPQQLPDPTTCPYIYSSGFVPPTLSFLNTKWVVYIFVYVCTSCCHLEEHTGMRTME